MFFTIRTGSLCACCALARHAPQTAAQRVARLFRRARRAPIPAPHANPPGGLTYSDLLLTTFQPMRSPLDWPQYARELDAAASGNASALETAARQIRTPANLSESTTSAAIQCADGPASRPLSAWPQVMGRLTRVGPLWAPFLGWTNWAPCAANWPGHPTERYTGPWHAKTKNPILLINNVFDPADSYTRAQRVERLLGNAVLLTVHSWGPPVLRAAQQVRRQMAGALPRASDHPAARDGLPDPAPVPVKPATDKAASNSRRS